jgi:hypothetical protein
VISRQVLFSFPAAMSAMAVAPSVATAAAAAPADRVSIVRDAGNATGATDVSGARKRHHAYRGSAAARNAFGSIVGDTVYGGTLYGGSPYEAPSYRGGYPGYGYGIGDNSRNQTW